MIQPSSVVLLVPEITRGMKSIGSKALLDINKNFTILDYQISYIKKYYKNIPIFVLSGFDNDRITKKILSYTNVFINHNPEYTIYNQSQSIIKYIKANNPNNFLLINNGVLLKERLPIDTSKCSIFMLPKKRDGFTIGSNNNSDIKYLFYNLEYNWSECIFFDRVSIQLIDKLSCTKKLDNLFLFELINILIDNNISLASKMLSSHKNVFKVNIIEDLKKLKNFYDKNIFTKCK